MIPNIAGGKLSIQQPFVRKPVLSTGVTVTDGQVDGQKDRHYSDRKTCNILTYMVTFMFCVIVSCMKI